MQQCSDPEFKRGDYLETLSRVFERIGGWSYDHRWFVLSTCVLLLLVCTFFASRAAFDNSFSAYFDRDDPIYAAYLKYREDFGSDEMSYVVYGAPGYTHGPWNLEVMRRVKKLTDDLENDVPFVKEVTSLTNVEFVEGVPGGIDIYDLLDAFPESQEALLDIKKKVLGKPIYVGGLASLDGKYAAILVETDKSAAVDPMDELKLDPEGGTGLDNLYPQATQKAVDEILSRPEYRGIEFYHSGDIPFYSAYNRISESESTILLGICILVLGALLLFFFRWHLGVFGPLAVVVLSVVVVVAAVNLAGWKLGLLFNMLPVLLIAVGVAGSVHIVSEFRAYRAELGDRREAVRRTMYLVGTPCLLTSLTTAAAFSAMSIAPIKAVSQFAVYSAAGVCAAFLLCVTLLLVLLSFGRRSAKRQATEKEILRAKGGRFFKETLDAISRFDIRHRWVIIIFFGVLFVLSAVGITKLRVDSNFLMDFAEDAPIRRTVTFVDNTMAGISSLVYLFDSGEPDGIKDPAVLREIERLQAEADKHTDVVTKSYSIVDLLKDINRSFHDGDPVYHVLPESRELVAQYLLLYEMSGGEELEEYVTGDYSRASLELRCKEVYASEYRALTDSLDSYLDANPLEASTVSVTGIGVLWRTLLYYITESQIRGFLLAFIVITAMMCFIFKSIKVGLLSMIPNLSAVLLTLGIMGWIGMPLNHIKLLIGTVAIGMSVDDTIHLMTRYRHEFLRSRDYAQALHAAMRDVGRALFITTVVLVLAFNVLLFSSMSVLSNFGFLVAVTIVGALIADFLLMPALVLAFKPFGSPGRPTGA